MNIKNLERKWGFSLIELLIAIAIIAILSAIAYPSYTTYVQKSQRSQALTTLLSIQAAYEQYYAQNNTYPASNSLLPTGNATTYYTYSSTTSATSPFYTIKAVGIGNQANDTENGTACGTLSVDSTGLQSPAACWTQ